jgi:hypothetical protein
LKATEPILAPDASKVASSGTPGGRELSIGSLRELTLGKIGARSVAPTDMLVNSPRTQQEPTSLAARRLDSRITT